MAYVHADRERSPELRVRAVASVAHLASVAPPDEVSSGGATEATATRWAAWRRTLDKIASAFDERLR